jgi:hypothetical protein
VEKVPEQVLGLVRVLVPVLEEEPVLEQVQELAEGMGVGQVWVKVPEQEVDLEQRGKVQEVDLVQMERVSEPAQVQEVEQG